MKTKVVQNNNRMSERQKNMPKDRLTERQMERQNDSMADSRAAKEPALVYYKQRFLGIDMKTKVVQHVPRIKINI